MDHLDVSAFFGMLCQPRERDEGALLNAELVPAV